MDIITQQAMKLVKERWFSQEEAVNIALEQQRKKWFVRGKQLTYQGKEYGKLSSEQRQKVRKKVEGWMEYDDFLFYRGNYFIKDEL